MAFVPDASIAAAWLLPDEDAALADRALDRLADETAKVPSLCWHGTAEPAIVSRTSEEN